MLLFPCEGKLLLRAGVFTGRRVTESRCKRERVSQGLARGLLVVRARVFVCVRVCVSVGPAAEGVVNG